MGVPLRISMDSLTFRKGYLLGFQWIPSHFARGTPLGLHWNSSAFEKYTIRISISFLTCCKGYPVGFQWMPLHFAMGSSEFVSGFPHILQGPHILQEAPVSILLDFLTFCNEYPHRNSVDVLAFCNEYPLGLQWNSSHVAWGAP